MVSPFSVSLGFSGSKVNSNILLNEGFDEECDFFFNLVQNGTIIHRSGWSKDNSFSMVLSESGTYCIQGHIRYKDQNIWERTKEIGFTHPKDRIINKNEFNVDLFSEGDVLTCQINGPEELKPRFCFYLMRYEVIIEKTDWQDNNEYSWDTTNLPPATYVVQGFTKLGAQRVNTFSNTVFVINNTDKQKVIRSLDQKSNLNFEMPKTTESHYPFSKFLIHVSEKESVETKLEFNQSPMLYTQLSKKNSTSTVHLLHDSKIKTFNKSKYLFSGTAKHNGNFIFGIQDTEEVNPKHLIDSIGNHSLVIIDSEGTVNVYNDLFGIQHHYYLKSGEETLVSNDLYLLMDYGSKNFSQLELNWEKMAADFCFTRVQPFHQNFSSNLNINGLKQQRSDESIHISQDVTFNKTKLDSMFHEVKSYNPERYEDYIKEAALEIIENVNIVYEHPRFKEVMIDLSGGMDSRSVFAAITNIKDAKKKFSLNCRHSDLEPNDLKIANLLNSEYNYPWNNSPRKKSIHRPSKIYGYQFGTYFSHRISSGFNKYPTQHIRLNGMYGEVTARPYYPRKFIREGEHYASTSDFIEDYFKKINCYSLLPSKGLGLDKLKNLFTEELEANPGRSALEKFDLHYLFFRAGLHCSEKWRNYIKGPEWGPLQSESLFKIKYGNFENHSLPKVQIDLIKQLNSELLKIPFGDEQDNLDCSNILGSKPDDIDLLTMKNGFKNSLKSWQLNEENKKTNVEVIEFNPASWNTGSDILTDLTLISNENTGQDTAYDSLQMLRFLYSHSNEEFQQSVIIPLVVYLQAGVRQQSDIQLKNKLISACAYVVFAKGHI